MSRQSARLGVLLQERHWQKYATFCREYEKAALGVDRALTASCPSRAQLHRWMSGNVKGTPYPDACIVLEKMFPGWSIKQLMEMIDSDVESGNGQAGEPVTQLGAIANDVATSFEQPGQSQIEWGQPGRDSSGRGRASRAMGAGDLAGEDPLTQAISRSVLTLATVRRLSDIEVKQLSALAGNLVELSMAIDIEVAEDGWSTVRYRHELFNMTDRPITRLARELWFENTGSGLTIEPLVADDRRIGIQRTHDTAHSAKFACQIAPAIQPGEYATVGYTCRGGQFVADHYWRQGIVRYTRHFTLRLRHSGTAALLNCSAIEEHPDGAENSAAEDLIWDTTDEGIVITLARDHLRPNQAITLRWERQA